MARVSEIELDVGQLLWIGFRGTSAPDYLLRLIAEGKAGGVILFKRNLEISSEVVTYAYGEAGLAPDLGGNPGLVSQVMAGRVAGERVPEAAVTREVVDLEALAALTGALHRANPTLPPLIAVDQEGGRVQRIRAPATLWPPMLDFDRLGDAEAEPLAEAVGEALGRELAVLGFDVDFAPVLDVHTNPDNPIIGDRAFASAPERAAVRALALARGLERGGVVPCGKHFPGHGDTATDSHLELPRIEHDLERLRRVELVPFERAAAAGLPMMMTAHIVFAALADGVPATLSPAVVTGLLREQLGFRGLIVSDDLDMNAISNHYPAGEAAVGAIRAGCDTLLLCCDTAAQRGAYEGLVRGAERDPDLRARIGAAAAAVRGLKRARFAAGLAAPTGEAIRALVGCAEHQELARRLAAAESTQ